VILAGFKAKIVLALIVVARTPIQSFAANKDQRKDESGAGPAGADLPASYRYYETC
jgi:hypothetical protein